MPKLWKCRDHRIGGKRKNIEELNVLAGREVRWEGRERFLGNITLAALKSARKAGDN